MKQVLAILVVCASLFSACSDSTEKTKTEEVSLIADIHAITEANDSVLADIKSKLKEGDLILRSGTDYSSEQIKDMSKEDKSYSHGGIAHFENNQWLVYHIEPDYFLVKDKVRKELIDTFLNKAHNNGFALARYELREKETQEFINYLEQQYQKKVKFDMAFNLKTDSAMYCSEMITKGLDLATQHKLKIEIQRLTDKSKFKIIKQYFHVPEKAFANMEIIPIDRLYLNPKCTIIQRYTYQ